MKRNLRKWTSRVLAVTLLLSLALTPQALEEPDEAIAGLGVEIEVERPIGRYVFRGDPLLIKLTDEESFCVALLLLSAWRGIGTY